MANISVKRIRYELRDVIRSEEVAECGIKVEMVNDSFYELKGEIKGPPDTPYEGGTFELEIKIPYRYPFEPPAIRFITRIWHVNISFSTGYLCLDILDRQWSALHTLRTILLSIQVLLATPEPNDPEEKVIAVQMRENPEMFVLTARHWTNFYAGGPITNESFDEKITTIAKLGFHDDEAIDTLSAYDWDLDESIKKLKKAYNMK